MTTPAFLSTLLPGDIIIVATTSFDWGDKAIRLANFYKRGNSQREWGHAAVYMGGDTIIESFPGKGVLQRKLSEAYLTDGKYSLLIMRREGLSGERLNSFLEFFPKQVGDGYDIKALIYYPLYMVMPSFIQWLLDFPVIEKFFNVSDRYYCSELVATGLQEAKDYCFERQPARVMPLDFKNSMIFTPVMQYTPPGWKKSGFFNALAGVLYFLVCVLMYLLSFILVVGLVAWIGSLAFGKKKTD